MDQSESGRPWGPQPPLVDQECSGPPWTTLRHFPDEDAGRKSGKVRCPDRNAIPKGIRSYNGMRQVSY